MANKTNSSEYLEYLMRSYRLSHVIFIAFEIGLFESIIKKNTSLNELSEELQVSRRGLGVLLPALVAMGIIEKQNHLYAVVEKFRAQLDPNTDDYLGNLINLEIHLKERWRFLTESVRNGKPVKQIDNNSDSARTRRSIKAIGSVGQRSASLFTTLFALHMLLSTETGRCYSEREILALMRNSKFKKGKITNLTENSLVIEGIRI